MIKKIALVLSIVFIIFISLFALDVFGNNFSVMALVMHLIPSLVLVVVTIISWKKEVLGGVLWLILGTLFLIMSLESWIIYVPAIIIGGLNVWAGKKKKLI